MQTWTMLMSACKFYLAHRCTAQTDYNCRQQQCSTQRQRSFWAVMPPPARYLLLLRAENETTAQNDMAPLSYLPVLCSLWRRKLKKNTQHPDYFQAKELAFLQLSPSFWLRETLRCTEGAWLQFVSHSPGHAQPFIPQFFFLVHQGTPPFEPFSN